MLALELSNSEPKPVGERNWPSLARIGERFLPRAKNERERRASSRIASPANLSCSSSLARCCYVRCAIFASSGFFFLEYADFSPRNFSTWKLSDWRFLRELKDELRASSSRFEQVTHDREARGKSANRAAIITERRSSGNWAKPTASPKAVVIVWRRRAKEEKRFEEAFFVEIEGSGNWWGQAYKKLATTAGRQPWKVSMWSGKLSVHLSWL